jgi:cytochrome c
MRKFLSISLLSYWNEIMSHFTNHLTPLNLPGGETSDTTDNQASAFYSPSRFIGRLGEVGIAKKIATLFCSYYLIAAMVLFFHPDAIMANSFYVKRASVSETNAATGASTDPQGKDLGIGPVKNVKLGPLDKKMIAEGKMIFTNQCVLCHDFNQNKLGPALKNVTKVRTPEYIMNLLLNSAQMQKENATVKALQKQFNNLPMPDPALNQSKARSVLEYLRSLDQ